MNNQPMSYILPYRIETLPYPRWIGIKHVKEFTLDKPLIVEQWWVPTGTRVKIYQTTNFGICVLPEKTQDERGFTIPRRIFRY